LQQARMITLKNCAMYSECTSIPNGKKMYMANLLIKN
jgi:hypothetical protein